MLCPGADAPSRRWLGVGAPARVNIIGVDYTALGQLWSPTLTTIDTDLRGLDITLSR